jgi:hypothetical protein
MSNHLSRNKTFYAEISKGYILKVMVDTLTGPLQRAYINIDKDGIKLRQPDSGNMVLYDIDLPRKNFRPFKCAKQMTISVNLKHMQGLLKNVKKKDSITMFIDPKYEGKFVIMIRPDGGKKNTRTETNSIVFQEEKDYKFDGLPEGGYLYPMVIEATDFQKIKRLTTIGKFVNVTIQRDNYLAFTCDAGVVYDSALEFGELLEHLDDDCGSPPGPANKRCYCSKPPEDCWCVCNKKNIPVNTKFRPKRGCGEYLCDCCCTCPECEEYLQDCLCPKKDKDGYDIEEGGDAVQYPDLFKKQYFSTILTKLVKLPGLCSQMQFYAPTTPCFPLKIEVNAGQGSFTLGTIQIFIKDVAQITLEQTLENGRDVLTVKGKGKRK